MTLLADRAAAAHAPPNSSALADRMLSMAAAYAKERHQFGKPIGSFQAVKHHLANARVALEFARPATYRAAWSLATAQPSLSHDASMAKAMASDAADLAARVALQVHGAIGYTWECDLHFFMKRTWALSRAWGDAAHPPQARAVAHARRSAGRRIGPLPLRARRSRPTRPEWGNVRFPPVIVTAACHAGTGDRGPGTLLRGGEEQGCPLRRGVLLRRDLDRHLLPAQLPRSHPEAGEHALLPHGRGRPAGGVPGLPALPPRRHPGLTGVERPGRHRGPGDAAHPRRHRRPRRGRGLGAAGSATAPANSTASSRPKSAPGRWHSPGPNAARRHASCSRRRTSRSRTSHSRLALPASASATTPSARSSLTRRVAFGRGRRSRRRPSATGNRRHHRPFT